MIKHPNFLIGGAGESGTSQLAHILIQHPDIYLPRQMRPEPHYFYKSWEYEKPLSYYLEKYFAEVTNEIAIGERSSSYLYMPQAAERVARVYPEMRWIFCLRNPIERAYANYRYTVLEGFEELSFEEALSNEKERCTHETGAFKEIQPHDYTGRGFYGRQLQHLLDLFPCHSVLCLKSEKLSARPYETLEKVYRFLGVAASFKPQMPPLFSSPSVQNPLVQKQCRDHFADRFDEVIEHIREHGQPPFFENKADQAAAERLAGNLTKGRSEMSAASRQYLRDLFATDMELLRALIDFDISDWN